jgi:hypothetical protein
MFKLQSRLLLLEGLSTHTLARPQTRLSGKARQAGPGQCSPKSGRDVGQVGTRQEGAKRGGRSELFYATSAIVSRLPDGTTTTEK